MSLPEVEHLYEVGPEGEPDGSITCIHIDGHVDTDTAVALAESYLIEIDSGGHRLDRTKHLWTTHVPYVDDDGEEHEGTWMAAYSVTERPGWQAVTAIDIDPHPYRPCAKCAWHAVRGFHVSNFIKLPKRGRDGDYLWFCRDHAADVSRRIDEARKAAYAAARAKASVLAETDGGEDR